MRLVSLLLLISCLLFPSISRATTPFGNVWIVKEGGIWLCPRMYTCSLIIYDKDKGAEREIDLNDLFPKEDYHKNVSMTTAGPLWGERAFSYILSHNDMDYFCMHCWTGKRILVNLTTGRAEDAESLVDLLDREEKQRTLEFLSEQAKLIAKSECDKIEEEKLYGAMLIIAINRMTQAKKYLEIIEERSLQNAFGYHSSNGYAKGLGDDLKRQGYEILEGRRFAQLTLRRLGFQTKGYSQYVFEKDKRETVLLPDIRKNNALALKTNTTSKQVYRLLGAPDYIMNVTAVHKTNSSMKKGLIDAWRYDFDPPDDFSIIISWDENGRARRIERVAPSLWCGDSLFNNDLQKPVFFADGSLDGAYLYSPHFFGKITVIDNR